MFQFLKVERTPGTATIILNRPDLNLISGTMIDEIIGVTEELGRDEDTRVVVITGAGNRAFTAGVDVNEMKDLDASSAREFISRLHRAIRGIRELDKVVIAAVNGYCFGGGCELAMACDLRIASENAEIGLPEIKVGIPSVIEAVLMPLLIGTARANELIFLGDPVTAKEAERIGLVNRVVPQDVLMETVSEMAGKILSYSPVAVKMQKRVLKRWLPPDMEEAIDYSIDAFSRCFETGDPAEAMTAFLEKRESRFGEGVR